MDKVQEVVGILNSLRPAMEADGGGVELIKIVNNKVYVRFKGACLFCPSIKLTLKLGLEKTLKENLPWVEEVVKE